MSKEIRLLVLGVGRRVELIESFRQAALVLEKKITIYGEDVDDTAPALLFCDKRVAVGKISDENYIGALLQLCIDNQIDVVIPTIDTNLLVLSKNKEKFLENGIRLLISSEEMVLKCRDKNDTSAFFVECGLKAPLPVNDVSKYDSGFPAFIKPKDGSSSIDAYKVDDQKELLMYASQVQDYIVQPFVSGQEYTVDIFADFEGNPIYIVPRIRLAVRAGEVLKTKIVLDEKIIEECKVLVSRFKPCGPMTVQLIRDENGDDYYIEINPRFGGGAPLSMKAGARSAESLIKLIEGGNPGYLQTNDNGRDIIEDGAIYSRFDQSVRVDLAR